MKLKEINRSATVAWSPTHSNYIAAGTVAGTMSLDFDPTGSLEILSTDLFSNNNSSEMSVVGKVQTKERLHKLAWSNLPTHKYGIIAGGLANGVINIWNPAAIIDNTQEDPLLSVATSHTGAVQGLDFNPFQQHLLASGGPNNEVYIWDLQNPSKPSVYTPGTMSGNQISSDITCVAWNKKVKHILATSTYAGTTIIWDLRAKRPVISFADQNKKIKVKSIAWSPDNPTTIITGSEDDEYPVINSWDLKNTFAPEKVLQGHNRGILSLSWCNIDTSLLLSTGKDNRVLCWDTISSEILCEVESTQNWAFDVQWAPQRGIISTCSLEGKVRVYSLQDFDNRPPSVDANADIFGQGGVVQQQKNASSETVKPKPPKRPPNWLARPVGATFAFGGKLVVHPKLTGQQSKGPIKVYNVVTEDVLIGRAEKLEKAIKEEKYKEFCEDKLKESTNEEDKATWGFIKVFFEKQARHELLSHLDFDPDKMTQKINEYIGTLPVPEGTESDDEEEEEEDDAGEEGEEKKEKSDSTTNVDSKKESSSSDATEGGDKPKDVTGLFGDGDSGSDAFNITPTTQQEQQTKPKVEKQPKVKPIGPPIQFSSSDNAESMITQALIVGDFTSAVDCCVRMGRMADALVLAACGGHQLWIKTQEIYFRQQNKTKPFVAIISSIVNNNLKDLVERADLSFWKETLAILCTYAKSEEFTVLCGLLGDRLQKEKGDHHSATLCYICSGSVDKTVAMWSSVGKAAGANEVVLSNSQLQDLIEKVVIFSHAIDREEVTEILATKFGEYAEVLANQGRLNIALHYLQNIKDQKLRATKGAVLLDRVFHSLGKKGDVPSFPFDYVQIGKGASKKVSSSTSNTTSSKSTKSTSTTNQPSAKTKTKKTGAKKTGTLPTNTTGTGTTTAPPASGDAAGVTAPPSSTKKKAGSTTPTTTKKKEPPPVTSSPHHVSHTKGTSSNSFNSSYQEPVPGSYTGVVGPGVVSPFGLVSPQTTPSKSSGTGAGVVLPGGPVNLFSTGTPGGGVINPLSGGSGATNILPPPPTSSSTANMYVPPPTTQKVEEVAPPPKTTKSTNKTEQTKPVEKKEVTADQQQTINELQQIIQNIKTTNEPNIDDIDARIKELTDKIEELPDAAYSALARFAKDVSESKYKDAKEAHQELTNQHYHAIGSKSMLGLKRMLQLVEKHKL